MEIINLIIMIQGFFWCVLFASGKTFTIEKKLLSLVMIISFLTATIDYIYTLNIIEFNSKIISVTFLLPVLLIPVIYSFVDLSARIRNQNRKKHWQIIYMILSIAFAIILYFPDEKFTQFILLIAFLIFVMIFLLLSEIQLFNYLSKKYYSNFRAEDYRIKIDIILLLTGNIIWSILFISTLLDYFDVGQLPGTNKLWIGTCAIISLFFTGYFQIKNDLNADHKKDYSKLIHKSTENDIEKKLSDAFDKYQLHLDAELTIDKLATFLTLDTLELSYFLNHVLKTNFFTFLNTKRVLEVKKRLNNEDNRKFTLLAIAYESGFNSKSTFNRVFKEIEGITPSAYFQKIKQQSIRN